MYRCPAHNTFRTLKGWSFHSSWCEAAWGVCEAQILKSEQRKTPKFTRPPWAVGMSNQKLVAIAKQEGITNLFERENTRDWYDGLDSVVIAEARAK